MNHLIRLQLTFILTLAVAGIAACGGGGGGGAPTGSSTKTGYFIDSAVEGLEYSSENSSGVTGADGSFKYEDGKPVTFKIGGITLGSVMVSNGRIFPVDLISGATDESNPKVTLIAQVLQSLDSDRNPANGITINDNTRRLITQSVNLATTDPTIVTPIFAQLLSTASQGALSMVSDTDAKTHLRSNLIKEYAGTWAGTYKGGDSGPCQINITTTGQLSGTCTSAAVGLFNVTGTVSSSGQFTQGSGTTGAVFSGTLSRNGTVSGTWTNSQYSISGTWSMAKQ